MKTTLDLPDELMRAIKVRAAQQDRKIKDVVAELLRRGLSGPAQGGDARRRVELPLVDCGEATGSEMTPQRLAEALLDEEAESLSGRRDAAL